MAALAIGPLSIGRTARPVAAGLALGLALIASAAPAGAQSMYRFVSAAGHLVFSDRLPTGAAMSGGAAADRTAQSPVWLQQAPGENGQTALVAINELAAWTQVAYRIESSRNLDPQVPRSGNFLLPPLSETRLSSLAAIDDESGPVMDISYQYLLGHPGARHRPEKPYRLPYSQAEAYRVSQAYPDVRTHASAANRHAIDFEMPIGTRVLAARDGLVVDTAGEFQSAGLDIDHLRDSANFVRILHEDGTLALYGHLNSQSIRVVPGQRVVRGQHIADSGNTGFSSGPHLHFVVQLNRAGAMESVPLTFAGAGGSALQLVTGDLPAAH